VLGLAPTRVQASPPNQAGDPQPAADEGPPRARPPTRLELGVFAGDYVYTVGSATQLRYAPTFDLRLAYGLARVGALGFVRVAAPIELPGSIATSVRQVGSAGGLGLRSMFLQHRWLRFGVSVIASVERLDSRVRLPALPGLPESEHVQRRVTHHAGLGLAHELGFVLPNRRGPTTVLTLGTSLTFVFPFAATRRGSDLDGVERYRAAELGVLSALGGATMLVDLGVMLGWDFVRARRRSTQG
jgi:hypothetical protein